MSKELFITREDLKDYIHSIHNFLRNNGAGYGAMGMKIFNVFYGLKLIQPYLNDFKLTDEHKKILDFNELVKKANDNNIEIMEYIDTKVSDVLYDLKNNDENDDSNNLGHLIYHQMPRGLKDNVWKDFIKKIERIPVGYSKERKVNLSGKVYEYFVGRDKNSISELGAYFTDRHITDFIYNKLEPTLDDNNNVKTMIDPFGGSGGFTLGYAFYLRQKFDNIDWSDNVNNIYHFDMEESVVNMTGLEMFAVTGAFPKRELNYERVNSFTYEFPDSMNGYKKYHYVISNPPYGGDKTTKSAEQIKRDKLITYIKSLDNKDDYKEQLKELKTLSDDYQKNQENQQVNLDHCSKRIKDFAKKYKLNGTDKEACSLMLLADLVATNGTAIGVLKEGVFFNRTYSNLRKCLVENYNVREIISVPSDQFENTSTKTSIIVFDNTEEKTSEVKFYDLVVEKYDEDKFEEVKGKISITDNKGDISGISDTLVSVASREEILANAICSLNSKDYNKKIIVCGEDYELVRLEDICEIKLGTRITKKEANEGNIPVYGGGDITFYTDKHNRDENTLIISRYAMSKECVRIIPNKFYLNDSGLSIHTKNLKLQKYVNQYLLTEYNQKYIYEYCTSGSIQRNINMAIFRNLQIPIPKSEQKIIEWVDKISKPYDEKNTKINKIKELEEYVKNKIKDIGENEECNEVELGSVCKFINGKKRNTTDGKPQGLYPLFSSSLVVDNWIDVYDYNEECIIINTINGSGKFNLQHANKFCRTSNTIVFNTENINLTLYIYYYGLNNLEIISNLANGSTKKKMGITEISKFKIKIPKNKQFIQDLEPTFDEIEKLQGEVKEAETLYDQLIKELSEEAIPVPSAPSAPSTASTASAPSAPSATSATSVPSATSAPSAAMTANIKELVQTPSVKSSESSTSSTSSIRSLHEQCKSLGIKGYSKYKKIEDKDKLLKLIEEHK
jgi:type I restriction-modification system DNA methylase subunit